MADHEQVEILLIEDNSNDIELLIRAMKKHNLINVMKVLRDGQEAIDYLMGTGECAGKPRYYPKVILLDLKLPKVSGLEVLQKIRSTPETKMLPVVVLTSSQEDPDVKECYKLGVNSYIVKPVEFDKFLETASELGFYWALLNKPPL